MKLTPQTYLVADTHFCHDAIMHLGHRPEDFNKRIVKNWNSVVGSKTDVLHLGDLVLANKEKAMGICGLLRGEKYLIRGNHDEAGEQWFKDCGFTTIEPIYKKFKDKYENKIHVLFTHEPVVDLPKGNWFNIHGHLHSATPQGDLNNHRHFNVTSHHYDVGVDANNFELVPLYRVLSLFFTLCEK